MLQHSTIIYSALTGDLPGALFALAEKLSGRTQDAAVEKQLGEFTQDLLLRLEREWKGRRLEDLPKSGDVLKALVRYYEAYRGTEDNQKRRILFNAFFNSFRPDFYDQSLSRRLWEKVENLEYPDYLLLAKVLEKTDPKERSTWWFGENNGLKWRGDQLPVDEASEEYEWARHLEGEGLVSIDHGDNGYVFVSRQGLADRVKEFALKEIEKWEPPTPPGEEVVAAPGSKKPSTSLTRAQLVGMIAAMRAFLIDEGIEKPKANELVDLTDFAVCPEDMVDGQLDMSWRTFER